MSLSARLIPPSTISSSKLSKIPVIIQSYRRNQ